MDLGSGTSTTGAAHGWELQLGLSSRWRLRSPPPSPRPASSRRRCPPAPTTRPPVHHTPTIPGCDRG
eukprot:370762-Rhodomonas_salina.2